MICEYKKQRRLPVGHTFTNKIDLGDTEQVWTYEITRELHRGINNITYELICKEKKMYYAGKAYLKEELMGQDRNIPTEYF